LDFYGLIIENDFLKLTDKWQAAEPPFKIPYFERRLYDAMIIQSRTACIGRWSRWVMAKSVFSICGLAGNRTALFRMGTT